MHVIQKHIVELEIPDEPDAFKWHRRVSQLVHEKLVPALDQIFDRSVGPWQVLEVDRLALTIHLRHEQLFEQQFTAEVIKALESELQQYKTSVSDKPLLTRPESNFKAFLYFLQHGYLPWWTEFSNPKEMEQKVLEALQVVPAAVSKAALKSGLVNIGAVERLINQFSTNLLEAFVALFVPQQVIYDLEVLRKVWFKARAMAQISSNQIQEAWRQAQVYFIWASITEEPVMTDLANRLFLAVQATHPHLFTPNFLLEFIRLYRPIYPGWSLSPEVGAVLNRPVPEINKTLNRIEKNSDPIKELTDTFVSDSEKTGPEETPEIYVANAGLILLAPFLPAYLQACGVAEEEKLIYPLVAAHALQYLVTGRTQTPEYELALNKILCGLPLTEALPLEIELTEVIQTEARQLLESVIQYWSALKYTSVEGLQESFLQRSGKLSQKPDGDWLLQVEQKSYDILLEQLPWAYSMVKLPWMPTLLWVEYS
ncbi:MAG: contractile injection system tape measure protein [Adhaeribacter sp.]